MPVVTKEQLKTWFSNLKKPPEGEFWAWLDSFRHILDKVPLDDVDGLKVVLSKKADLVNGVVPEDQLPFSIVTSEVITLGSVELIDTKTYLRLHSSGANKVRVKGKLITRTFQNQWTITPIVADGVKVLRGYAVKNNDDFLLAEGAELPTYVEPEIPEDALEIFKITMRSSGNVIEQTETGLKYIAEDGWRNILLTEELTVLPYNFDLKSSYWINSRVANPVIGGIHNGVIDRNASPTWDGKEFWLFNNTGGDLLLDPSNVTAIDVYLFSDKLMPLTIKKSNAVLLKLKDNVIEIMQGGGGGASFPVSGGDGDVLVKGGTSALWSSIIKGVEFLGNAWLKLKLISFQGYTIAQKNAIASPTEGMLIYQNENPKGFQKYEGGTWSAIGSNISNADLSNVSARTFTQGNIFTWNTAGFFYYLKGLIDKTGNAAYSKVVVVHPTTGEMVTRDFADPAATTLAVQNANSAQKTAMRTALLGTATPANPVLQSCSPRFSQRGLSIIEIYGLNLTLLDPTSIWIEKLDGTKIYATNFYNISSVAVTTQWNFPSDLPEAEYQIKIQNGVAVQGLSTASINIVSVISNVVLSTANWKRKMRDVNGVEVSYTAGYNYAIDNFIQTRHSDITGFATGNPDRIAAVIFKSQNVFLGNKDWDILIRLDLIAINSANENNGFPYIGLTQTSHTDFTSILNIAYNHFVTESINQIGLPLQSSFGAGNFNIYLSKVGSTLYMRFSNFGNTSFQYYQTNIDNSLDYALFIRDSTHPSQPTWWAQRQHSITARIMN